MGERVTTDLTKRYAEGGMSLGPAAVADLALDLLDARATLAAIGAHCDLVGVPAGDVKDRVLAMALAIKMAGGA